ncbi:MAG: hypothetical protein EPN14_11750 [Gallionella sp.]|nr:MAG: hypothetical protein EPN14_11750 [Gallionella sp.]
MFRFHRKFVAVLVAIWLPLFGGNALAMAVYMPGGGAVGHAVAAEHGQAHADAQHHMAAAMDHCATHDDSAGSHTQSDTGCKHSAACQLAVAAGQVEIALLVLSEHVTPYMTLFQSQTVAPLYTPPLARA